jgi:hypothetical protein
MLANQSRCGQAKLCCDRTLLHVWKVSFAQQWAAAADKPQERITTAQIPLKYQKHWKVFDEE